MWQWLEVKEGKINGVEEDLRLFSSLWDMTGLSKIEKDLQRTAGRLDHFGGGKLGDGRGPA